MEVTRTALRESMHRHLVSDVPVGILLSGGLDSSALVALAMKEGQKDIATFSIGVEDDLLDEATPARQLAGFFHTKHHELLLTQELARHWREDFLGSLDQPTVDGFNTYCACKLVASHGYKVVLSGVGGDELFGGYPSFRTVPRLLRLGRALDPFRVVMSPVAKWWERTVPSGRLRRAAHFLQHRPTVVTAYGATRSIFGPQERAYLGGRMFNVDFDPPAAGDQEKFLPPGIADAVSHLEWTRYLRNQLLRDADVMSMAHGVELRTPFVDIGIFEKVGAISAEIRFQAHKQLLRDALPELPSGLVSRCKRGFSLPFDRWLENDWSDLSKSLPRLKNLPLRPWGRRWSFIILQDWCRRHQVSGGLEI